MGAKRLGHRGGRHKWGGAGSLLLSELTPYLSLSCLCSPGVTVGQEPLRWDKAGSGPCVWQDIAFGWPPSRGCPGLGLGLPGPAGKDDLIWIQGLPQLSRKTQKETQGWVGEMISQQLEFQTRIPQFELPPLPPHPLPHSWALMERPGKQLDQEGWLPIKSQD